MLTLTAVFFFFSAQLASADIAIELSRNSARVEAHFILLSNSDSLRLSFIRLPDQRLEPLDPDDARADRASWETRRGLTWIAVPAPEPTDDGRSEIRVRYRLTGNVERIPLPVPQISAEPGRGAVTLRVRGLEASARLLDGFPRLVWQSKGSAVARLDNVPSFLRQPPAGAAWSVSRGAQWFVVLLVIGGSTAWLLRARRRRRALATGAAGTV